MNSLPMPTQFLHPPRTLDWIKGAPSICLGLPRLLRLGLRSADGGAGFLLRLLTGLTASVRRPIGGFSFARMLAFLASFALLLLLELLILALDQRDQRVAATLQLGGGSALDEPVEAELRSLADGRSQFVVDIVRTVEAELVDHADQEAVLFLGVVLALVRAVGNPQLVEGRAIPGHLRVESSFDTGSPLDASLALLNLGHYLLNVLEHERGMGQIG